MKIKHFFIALFTVVLFTSMTLNVVNAENNEEPLLFQAIENITLEEGLTILKNSYFYGIELDEKIKVQFSDSHTYIPKDSVVIVPDFDSKPEFKSYESISNHEILPFNQNSTITSKTGLSSIIFDTESQYPVYIVDDKSILIFGNMEFHVEEILPNDDLEQETKEGSDEDTNTDTKTENDNAFIPEDTSKPKSAHNISKNSNKNEKNSQLLQTDPWKGISSNFFKVTKDYLIVYDGIKHNSNKIIGKLYKDQVYPIVSTEGNWHKIQFGNNFGYVSKVGTIPDSGSIIKNINSKYKNKSNVFNTYKDVIVYDNTSGKLVPFGIISKGQSYPIVSDYGNWWRIIISDRVGYVRKSDVALPFTKNDKYFKTLSDLVIYDNRTGSLVKVGELKKGQIYPRVSDYGNWHRIQFGNIFGYVRKAETIPVNASSLKNLNTKYKAQSRTFKALETVTVYDNTSGKLVPFGTIDKGFSEFSITSDYGNWWRIIYADRIGYIRKSEVEVSFTKDDKYFKAEMNLPIYDNRSGKLVKIGEVQKGQVYPRVKDFGNWHQIRFGNIYGYVRKSGTTPANASSLKNLNTKYKTQSRTFKALETVTVYDNTSGKLVPFGTIDKGFSEFSITSDYGNWWRIVYADRIGYINKDFVQVSFKSNDKFFRPIKNIPIYDNRSGKLEKVGEVLKGQVYPIFSDYGNWWRVQFSDHFGFVRKSETGYSSGVEIKNRNNNYKHSRDYFTVKNNDITVYDNTSGKLVPFGTIEKNTKYFIASDYGNWWRIIYLDRVGYVRKSEVIETRIPNLIIVIDPGHGGHDPGALGNGLREKDINLDIAKRVQSMLQSKDISVIMTRTTDKHLSLSERSSLANNLNADLFVSIHVNSFNNESANGIETWWYSKGPEPNKSKLLAEQIQKEVINQTRMNNRGVKDGNLHVNRETKMPSALIEVGFISNKNDAAKLKTSSYRQQVANGIVNGIKAYIQLYL